MTTTTLDATMPARSRGTLAVLILTGLAALTFVALVATPYFALDEARFGPYWPRRWMLLLHIAGGMVAILSGPVQLWLGLTDRRPALHRRLGVVYIVAVLVGSLAGYSLAFTTTFGWLFGAGLAGLASVWLITTGMAVLAIRRSLLDQHKEWMIRSYVVTFAFVFFRVVFPAVQAADIGTLDEQFAFAGWAAWTFPLVITEAVLQGRKIMKVAPTR